MFKVIIEPVYDVPDGKKLMKMQKTLTIFGIRVYRKICIATKEDINDFHCYLQL